jgi:hypothetical protein
MHEPLTPVGRADRRFSFVASAKVTRVRDGTCVIARLSDLSTRGCYVDTIDPFPIGTVLLLHVRYGSKTCTVSGKVVYTHSGCGMGVLFENLAVEERSAIDDWLRELARK